MQILLFHGDLTKPSGGEVNARDWALGFKARGHKVSIYSPRLGHLAEQIRAHGVQAVNDPSAIVDTPDVIMGSGVNELATLLARFPRSAGIQVAQRWDHWNVSPCPLPQVVLHIAVSELLVRMLAYEFGVSRERIRLVYNAVDVGRIALRLTPLPPRPRRMLVFAKNQSDYFDSVRDACSSRNIEVDFLGNWIGRTIDDPLKIIREYDLVLGSGRTAIEGAACGAAVLVADGRGLAGMLSASNFEHFRRYNFGLELLIRPLTSQLIGEEIDAYDAQDAAKVWRLALEDARLDRQLEKLELIFGEAIELIAKAKLSDDVLNRTLSSYLARHLPRTVEGEDSPRHRGFRLGGVESRNRFAGSAPHAEMQTLTAKIPALNDRTSALTEQASAPKGDHAGLPLGRFK